MTEPRRRAADPAPPVMTQDQAELLVPRRAFMPIRDFLVVWEEALSAALEARVWGFGFTRLAENLDNFGRFFMRSDGPAPQLWFGIAWGVDDAPGTLPSWGASLQVEGEWVRDWERNAGGLKAAMNRAARDSNETLGLYEFEQHVELAEWRNLDEVLAAPDQVRYLVDYWASFSEQLARAEIPEAVDDFVTEAFGY